MYPSSVLPCSRWFLRDAIESALPGEASNQPSEIIAAETAAPLLLDPEPRLGVSFSGLICSITDTTNEKSKVDIREGGTRGMAASTSRKLRGSPCRGPVRAIRCVARGCTGGGPAPCPLSSQDRWTSWRPTSLAIMIAT